MVTTTTGIKRWASGRSFASVARLCSLISVIFQCHCIPGRMASDLRIISQLAQAPQLSGLPKARPATLLAVAGAETVHLTVDQAVELALSNNPLLRSMGHESQVLRGRLSQAALPENPTVGVELTPERDTRTELRVGYNLTNLWLSPMRAKAGAAELAAERVRVAEAAIRLRLAVRKAFYCLLAAQSQYALAEQAVDTSAASRDAAVALRASGNMTEMEATAIIAEYQSSRLYLAEMELIHTQRRETMQRLLGTYGTDICWQLDGKLSPPKDVPVAISEGSAVSANLRLLGQRHQLETAARKALIAQTEGWLPRLDVDVHRLQGDPRSASQLSGNSWGGGLSVSLPVFDRNQGSVQAEHAVFDTVLEQSNAQAIEVRSYVRAQNAQRAIAAMRAKHYIDVLLPTQAHLMEEVERQYNAMQISVLTVLQRRQKQIEVESSAVDATLDYWLADAQAAAISEGLASPTTISGD